MRKIKYFLEDFHRLVLAAEKMADCQEKVAKRLEGIEEYTRRILLLADDYVSWALQGVKFPINGINFGALTKEEREMYINGEKLPEEAIERGKMYREYKKL